MFRSLLILFLILFSNLKLFAADSNYVIVRKIEISGNQKTRDYIIQREVGFKVGDTLRTTSLQADLVWVQNRVFNTHLFNEVHVTHELQSNKLTLKIQVIERWYVWPYAELGFADRNFNIWWETQDIDRLNLNLNVQHYNFRGRNEKLKIEGSIGYTVGLGIDYDIPFIDSKKKHGLRFLAHSFSNKEIWYRAEDNRLQFLFDDKERSFRNSGVNVIYTYRPGLWVRNYLGLFYEQVAVGDTILQVESEMNYLAGGRTRQSRVGVSLGFRVDRRDIAYYPRSGYLLSASVVPSYLLEEREWFTRIRVEWNQFVPTHDKGFIGFGLYAKFAAGPQPYNLYRSLGYEYFIRGFEPYVIDGEHTGLFKSSYRLILVDRILELPWPKRKEFNRMPVTLTTGPHFDAGYVSASRTILGNTYRNQLLSGYGWGIDFVTYYDKVLRLEYSVNNWGRGGLYVHFVAPI